MTARLGTFRSCNQGLKLMLRQLYLQASVKQGQLICFSKKDISIATFINISNLSSYLAPGFPIPFSYFLYTSDKKCYIWPYTRMKQYEMSPKELQQRQGGAPLINSNFPLKTTKGSVLAGKYFGQAQIFSMLMVMCITWKLLFSRHRECLHKP